MSRVALALFTIKFKGFSSTAKMSLQATRSSPEKEKCHLFSNLESEVNRPVSSLNRFAR